MPMVQQLSRRLKPMRQLPCMQKICGTRSGPSLYCIPATADLLKTTALPFALTISPIVNFGELGPIRCNRSKPYKSSNMQFVDAGCCFQYLMCKCQLNISNIWIIFCVKNVWVPITLKLVELKNGETYNGHLVSCDSWMNINLRDVICTSKDGDRFWRMPECYVRGSTIKYLRIPDEVIDMVKDDVQAKSRNRSEHKGRIGVGAQNQSVRGQFRPRFKNVQENGMKSAPRGQSGRPVTHNSAHKNRK
ncbi:uncharacterized protein [Eurosta solidaginis]|uniref:uncharacterized protein n=1 Tax=Eurosta solidaginis TaxID=178769 RepID=UPI0035310A2A